jgi:alanyl-tRNA synthetase
MAQANELGKAKLLVAKHEGDADTLRKLAASLRDRLGDSVVILGTADGGAPKLVAAVSKALGLNAKDLLADAAKRIGGGAGGKPDLAMAGGRDASGLDEALATARAEAERQLS